MFSKYKAASRLGKVFVWLSIGIFIAVVALYIYEVREALAMDPDSYNCLHDSMMKPMCKDPFGTAAFWTALEIVFFAWPILLAWTLIGVILMRRRVRGHRLEKRKDI